ncbi:SDR family NAD(P)-dependent oxidoreductase [Paenibacillus xanthanilyticus]|uniref:SDR family NAD(P)-dependent oxidoreductase n=1 Tax=Paenibacillus xanthanilyticus TaxID=1783531 RepID=A0ABV8K779_9BACL
MFTFEGQSVLITGATGGIGRHLSFGYAAAGARTILTDKDEAAGQQLAKEIREAGGQAEFFAADLGSPADIAALFNRVNEQAESIDILINNAGFGIWKSPLELSVEEWDNVVNVNLRGTFLCAREAAIRMKAQGRGRIVNIASTRAAMSEPNGEAYAATKGGIVSLTHALAVSLGGHGITVNCISPGWIENGDYDALRPADHAQHPSGRVGKPDDILKACFYLTGPGNDFVTGINLTVDGGMTHRMIYEE